MTIRRILIPLGGGDAEGTILPRLRYLLQKTRAKAIVLRVVEPRDDEELKEARTQTREAAARLIDRGIETTITALAAAFFLVGLVVGGIVAWVRRGAPAVTGSAAAAALEPN